MQRVAKREMGSYQSSQPLSKISSSNVQSAGA